MENYKIEIEISNLSKPQYEKIWQQLSEINSQTDKEITMKSTQTEPPAEPFPNGFTSWHETHFEVVAEIARELHADPIQSPVISKRYDDQGHGGMYELAHELTIEFENLNKGRQWDGEFFDEIEEFLTKKLYENE